MGRGSVCVCVCGGGGGHRAVRLRAKISVFGSAPVHRTSPPKQLSTSCTVLIFISVPQGRSPLQNDAQGASCGQRTPLPEPGCTAAAAAAMPPAAPTPGAALMLIWFAEQPSCLNEKGPDAVSFT